MLAETLANRLSNLPGLTVKARRVQQIAGQEAARVEVIAQGTGDALAPSGVGTPVSPSGRPLVPTHQVTVAFARSGGPLYLSWHFSESAASGLAPEIEATLSGLELSADVGRSSDSY